MSTYSAKVAGALSRGGGPQQHHQHAGLQQQNGGAKSNPVRQTVGFSVASSNSGADRLGFIGNVLIGYKVELQVVSGLVYEGVFGSFQNDSSGASFILKYAKIIRDPKAATDRTALAEKPVPVLTIPASDMVQLVAKDVRFSPEDLSGADRSDVGFETDAAISRGRGGCVRELQRWQPEEGDDSSFFNLESTTNAGPGWDQFAVNRDRFGVQTTWNEHFYTTKIDRDKCGISEAEAQRLANEIEKGVSTSTTNIHLLEERGGELAPDVDEEALYGAVIRSNLPGAYQHPHQQQQQPHQQQQQQHQQHQRQQQRSRAPQQSAADRVTAWGRAGSGVAAVAGGLTAAQQQQQQHHHQQQRGSVSGGGAPSAKSTAVPVPVPSAPSSAGGAPPAAADGGSGSAGSSTAGGTAPIDIDPRREVNKVRSSLTTWPKKDRSSPYGTPRLGMSRSPAFASPLVADPVSFSALDLDPGAPQVRLDPEAQAEFLRFKEEQMKKRAGQMGAEAALADLKKTASSSLKDRAAAPAGNGTAAAQSGSEPAAAAPVAAEAPAPAAAAAAPSAPAATAAAAAAPAAPTATAPAAPAAAGSAAAAPAAAVTPALAAAAPAAADGEPPKPKLVSKLNPNAKPFSLNIYAKEFVPSFAAKPAAPAAAAPAASSTASAVAPAASTSSNNTAPAASTPSAAPVAASAVAAAAVPAVTVVAAPIAAAPNATSAPPAAAAAAAQAATTALSSGQATYLPASSAHGLTVYHHSNTGHGHGASQQSHYGHAGQSALHASHGHGVHHERGYGGGGPMGREMREHGGMYHRGGDSYRAGADGGGGYRGGGAGGGDPFRSGAASGSGDGYHHHHQQHHHHHHKGGAEHHMVKGADAHGGGPGGLHKVPPPPPQGPMAPEGPMGAVIVNGVGPTAMGAHVLGAMAPMSAAGMPPMGYSVVMASPAGGYMTSTMPPGTVAIPATAGGGVSIMYMQRPATGGPAMAMAPGLAMMSAPGMAGPYAHAVGPYMTAAPPGGMPPPSPTGRPPSTGYFQPAGAYPLLAPAHPGGPHGHPGGAMGGQPGGPMGGHHMMQGPGGHGHGHGHGHGPAGHMAQHMQDGRGPGGMGPGGPKGGGRQGGRPPRMDHDRSGPMSRDMD